MFFIAKAIEVKMLYKNSVAGIKIPDFKRMFFNNIIVSIYPPDSWDNVVDVKWGDYYQDPFSVILKVPCPLVFHLFFKFCMVFSVVKQTPVMDVYHTLQKASLHMALLSAVTR